MLISRETFGIALDKPLHLWSAPEARLAEQGVTAGAGAVRAPGSAHHLSTGPARALMATAAVVAVSRTADLPAEGAAIQLAISDAEAHPVYLELTIETPGDLASLTEERLKVVSFPLVLGLDVRPPADADLPPPDLPDLGAETLSRFVAMGVRVRGDAESSDPKQMEFKLRSLVAPFRARGWQHPTWLTELSAWREAAPDEQVAWLLKFGAHALALGVAQLFVRLDPADPEHALRALRTMAAWLEGARRITWLARGQYRAEFEDRPNRYLLWRDPELDRLPSSLQGPLSVRTIRGETERIETTRLRLTDDPVLVERLERIPAPAR